MKLEFWKMHGAGNDFVLLDDRERVFPCEDTERIARMASRRTGVGCEGVILIQPSDKADFRMRFFNPDGGEVEMCGNGARCVARLACELGVTGATMRIDTVAGILDAEVSGDQVKLTMTPPIDWVIDGELDLDGSPLAYGKVNTGVPHVVVITEDVSQIDVQKLGAGIRYHRAFAPDGTNANFVAVTGPQAIRIRTYERGVEGETLACGTGIVASALIAAKTRGLSAPVSVQAASGDELTVDFTLTESGAENVSLLGPAVHVFQGTLDV